MMDCAMKMIDKVASCPEMEIISHKTSFDTSRSFNREQIFHCPRPETKAHDDGEEITKDFQDTLQYH